MFSIWFPRSRRIRRATSVASVSVFAILVRTVGQFEDEPTTAVVDSNIKRLLVLTYVGTGRFPPPNGGHALPNPLYFGLGKQIRERVGPNWLPVRGVEHNHRAVAHVVPIVQ